MEMTKAEVLTFIKSQKLAVISTCGKNRFPEAALMGFGETEQLELIFGTNKATRKYKNLQENNRVALVIGWENGVSVQYEGDAIELEVAERPKFLDLYHQKVPSARKYESLPGQTYFKVIPRWIRYVDLGKGENNSIEFSF